MTTVDLPERIGEEILACKVCFLQYAADNQPKLLPCSHTFCVACISDYLRRTPTRARFPCPLCRQETSLAGPDSVQSLPNNYTILDLMDLVAESPAAISQGPVTLQSPPTSALSAPTRPASSTGHEGTPHNNTGLYPDLTVTDTSTKHSDKCCRCTRNKGVHEIKCQHKICKSCKKREKKMDVLPCQICLAMSSGVNYYMEDQPPPYCEHEDDRPPAYNPDLYTYGDNGTSSVTGAPTGAPTQPGYTQEQIDPRQHGNSQTTAASVTQSLSDDFVSRVQIESRPEALNPVGGLPYQAPHAVNLTYQATSQYPQNGYPPAMPSTQGKVYPQQSQGQPQGQGQLQGQSAVNEPDVPTYVVGQPQTGPATGAQPSRPAPVAPAQATSPETRPTPSPPHRATPPPQQAMVGAVPVFPGVMTSRDPVRVPQHPASDGVSVFVNPEIRAMPFPPKPRSREASPTPTPAAPPAVKRRQVPAPPLKLAGDTSASSLSKRSSQPRTENPAVSPTGVQSGSTTPTGQVPLAAAPPGPKVPPRHLLGEPQGLPFKCVRKFGRYSENKMQSGAFQKPTRVSVAENGGIVVTDDQAMTVQIFTAEGEYTYMFKVLGIQGACMWAQDKLAVATHRGVEIYNVSGYQEKELLIGPVLNTVPYKYGFIAVKQKSLVFYGPNLSQTKEISKKKIKGAFKKSVLFENIKDVAVSMSKDIVVLEGPSGEMTIIDEDGVVKNTIQPANESCGKLGDPFAVTFDRWSNIFVSDLQSKKVLRFSPNGRFSRCVLNFTLGETTTPLSDLKAHGVSASAAADHLITVIGGATCAEVRVYKLY